jgi:hypothetical protein
MHHEKVTCVIESDHGERNWCSGENSCSCVDSHFFFQILIQILCQSREVILTHACCLWHRERGGRGKGKEGTAIPATGPGGP